MAEYKWNNVYEWFADYVEHQSEAVLRQELLVLGRKVGDDTLQSIYESDMEGDGYFEPVGKECPNCGASYAHCAECGKEFPHGTVSNCDEESCVEVNAPLDCVCGLSVCDGAKGLVHYNGTFIPYRTD